MDRLIAPHPVGCSLLSIASPRDIEDSSQCLFADRYGNRSACCDRIHSSYQSVSRSHGNTSDSIVAQMLCHFYNELLPFSPRSMRIASLISGRLPSANLISSTAPITCVIFPICLFPCHLFSIHSVFATLLDRALCTCYNFG